jgi:hypothetical protein
VTEIGMCGWASRIRIVRVAKQGSMFAYPEHIDREMRRLFRTLAAERYSELGGGGVCNKIRALPG